MAHAWKACWGQPLEGSNPSSSATPRRTPAGGIDQLSAEGEAADPRAVGVIRLDLNPHSSPGRDRGRVNGEGGRRGGIVIGRKNPGQDLARADGEVGAILRQLTLEADETRHAVGPERALQTGRIVQLADGDLDQTRGPGRDRPGR